MRPPVPTPERPAVIDLWRRGLVRLMGPTGAIVMVFVVMIFQAPMRLGTTMAAVGAKAPVALLSAGDSLPPLYHHSVLNHCDYPIFGWTNSALPPEGIAHFRK